MITVNAMVASSHIIIPIQSSYFALEGTDDLLETIEKIKSRPNPSLQILGVVITLHDRRTVLGRDIQKQIDAVFQGKLFKTTVSKSIRLEESPAYRESIFTFAPEIDGRLRVLQPDRGDPGTCLSAAGSPRPPGCATTPISSISSSAARRSPSAAGSPSTSSRRTRISPEACSAT